MAPFYQVSIHDSNEVFDEISSTSTSHEIDIDSAIIATNSDNIHASRIFLMTVILISLCLICYYAVRIFRIVTGRDVDPPSRCMGQKGRQVHRPAIFVTSVRAPNTPGYASSPPTVYVTPLQHQPPPRYEASAPPSYDEVVGTHSPAAAQVRTQTTI